MTLVSFPFALFVLGLLPVYYALSRRGQNALLLAASLVFCALFDVRAVVLLVAATLVDFGLGRRLAWDRPDRQRRLAMWTSVGLGVFLIAAFKYGAPALAVVSQHGPGEPAHHFVPIGLSFYTLARLTHTLDVYFRVVPPAESLLEFATFTAFFPTLVSGPIERAKTFLPQLGERRVFDWSRAEGAFFLIGVGLFRKVYVADTCAMIVSDFFDLQKGPNGAETLLGIYAYALQIYGDFAGYSDIVRGVSRLFGVDITQNFDAPYLASSLADYWKRWHVSFSSFLDDYVFAPAAMTFRGLGTAGVVIATWITFLTSGLWHGRGLTFVSWGAIHAFGLTVYVLTRKTRKRLGKRAPRAFASVSTVMTFAYVCFAYVFFRAESVGAAFATLLRLSGSYAVTGRIQDYALDLVAITVLGLSLDAVASREKNALFVLERPMWVRAACYAVLLFCILRLHAPAEAFVYAQF